MKTGVAQVVGCAFNNDDPSIGKDLAAFRTTANYTTNRPIQKAIQRLKYEGQTDLAITLGQRLVDTFAKTSWQPTLIVAVPLHPLRLRERGYNQAALLADVLAQGIGVPFHRETLRKVKYTRPQVGLRKDQRIANIAGAFLAERDLVQNQRVLLIDDVCTTGATLNACATALHKAGAAKIYGLTVASVPLDTEQNKQCSKRAPSLRIVTAKRGYRYVQLVHADGHTKSLGAFNPLDPTPLLDHVLLQAFKVNMLDLNDLIAVRDARKEQRDYGLKWQDWDNWAT
jgi:ComF family protein